MMGKDKNGMMANGMTRTSHPQRGMMGEDSMMDQNGMMDKDRMNAGKGTAYHEKHTTGTGNGMTEGMTKPRSIEYNLSNLFRTWQMLTIRY
jgi:hypothetical protein